LTLSKWTPLLRDKRACTEIGGGEKKKQISKSAAFALVLYRVSEEMQLDEPTRPLLLKRGLAIPALGSFLNGAGEDSGT